MADQQTGGKPPPALKAGGRRRRRWERRYQHKRGPDFIWYLAEPPPELRRLLEERRFPDGAALDLGCGPGVATALLGRSFAPTVGLDVAFGALAQARHRLQAEGVTGSFVLAEAPVLPFASSAFALVFDRGCLQAIPREGWPTYFREVARVLRGGGVLQLFCSKPTKRFPPLLSYRGVRARLRWFLGRRGPQFLSHDLLQRLAEPSLRPVVLEDLPMQLSTGPPRVMTHAIFEKNGQESPNVDPMTPRP